MVNEHTYAQKNECDRSGDSICHSNILQLPWTGAGSLWPSATPLGRRSSAFYPPAFLLTASPSWEYKLGPIPDVPIWKSQDDSFHNQHVLSLLPHSFHLYLALCIICLPLCLLPWILSSFESKLFLWFTSR